MASTPHIPPAAPSAPTRLRVFIDYWNLQLSLNEKEAKDRGLADYRFKIAWAAVGPKLAARACAAAGIAAFSCDATHVYTSYTDRGVDGAKFLKWATTWLNRQPGVVVSCRARKPRGHYRCPACFTIIEDCPRCRRKMVRMVEKGIDTLIATDMIRLAWEDAYDVAVLSTSDADLVPAVEFLGGRGIRVIQAGFPPGGIELATACRASFDVYRYRSEIERAP